MGDEKSSPFLFIRNESSYLRQRTYAFCRHFDGVKITTRECRVYWDRGSWTCTSEKWRLSCIRHRTGDGHSGSTGGRGLHLLRGKFISTAGTQLDHSTLRAALMRFRSIDEGNGQFSWIISRFRRWWSDNCGLNTRRKPCTISWMPPLRAMWRQSRFLQL